MTEYAILTFRAKRLDDVTRWMPTDNGHSVTDGHTAYNVPKLTSNHVATPRTEQGMRHALMFGHSTSDAIRKSRTENLLRAHGLDPYRVFTQDADLFPNVVTIEPDKSGFMATVTLRLDLSRKP